MNFRCVAAVSSLPLHGLRRPMGGVMGRVLESAMRREHTRSIRESASYPSRFEWSRLRRPILIQTRLDVRRMFFPMCACPQMAAAMQAPPAQAQAVGGHGVPGPCGPMGSRSSLDPLQRALRAMHIAHAVGLGINSNGRHILRLPPANCKMLPCLCYAMAHGGGSQ